MRTASAMLASNEHCISWEHLPDDIAEDLLTRSGSATVSAAMVTPKPVPAPRCKHDPQNMEQHMRLLVQQALQTAGGNVSQAARTLGISRQTLYKKMKPP
jgi:transcriptional regulator of acetoin/glycerol metabolism